MRNNSIIPEFYIIKFGKYTLPISKNYSKKIFKETMSFIKCLECRTFLGLTKNFREAYICGIKMLDTDKLKEISPDKLNTAPDAIPDLADLFNDLGLENICCRTHMLTAFPFHKLLNFRTEI